MRPAAVAALCAVATAQDDTTYSDDAIKATLPPQPQFTPLHTAVPLPFVDSVNGDKNVTWLDAYGNNFDVRSRDDALRHARTMIVNFKDDTMKRIDGVYDTRKGHIDHEYHTYKHAVRKAVDKIVDDAKPAAETKCKLQKDANEKAEKDALKPVTDKYEQVRSDAKAAYDKARSDAKAAYDAKVKSIKAKKPGSAARMAVETETNAPVVSPVVIIAAAAATVVGIVARSRRRPAVTEVPVHGKMGDEAGGYGTV